MKHNRIYKYIKQKKAYELLYKKETEELWTNKQYIDHDHICILYELLINTRKPKKKDIIRFIANCSNSNSDKKYGYIFGSECLCDCCKYQYRIDYELTGIDIVAPARPKE